MKTMFDDAFLKFRYTYPLLPPVSIDEIKKEKIKLATDIGSADSIRDFGGLWGVLGLYLIEGAKGLNCRIAQMVDVTPLPEFDEKAKAAQEIVPTEYNVFPADFRKPFIYGYLKNMDVSLLYEVILHQENHVEVIKNVIEKTDKVICFAQPVMKEELFSLPGGCTLLQFFPEELKNLIRCPSWWEKEPVVESFDTRFWMWGHTASYIITVFKGFGWELTFQKMYEMSDHWNYALMRFCPNPSHRAA